MATNAEQARAPVEAAQIWARELFALSPLKQRKVYYVTRLLGDYSQKRCLDIGSDNGVVSLVLRDRGGEWSSADLIPETVESIRGLVGERVYQVDGRKTEFSDQHFDAVAIVDFLEHIETDREFIEEVARIVKPGGTLIVNVPNPHPGLLRKLRFALGQTDEAHGHVRPGYSVEALRSLLGNRFEIQETHAYGRVFSELVDTVITAALDLLKPGGRSKKGSVVTGKDMRGLRKSMRMYRLLYPLLWSMVQLDTIVPFLPANMLIVRARRCEGR